MPMIRKSLCAIAITALAAGPGAAAAQTADQLPPLTREAEIALALSAAPEQVADRAAVWVMGPDGFQLAREGSNGYACLVDRGESGRGRIPICHNAEGSATRMQVEFARHQLMLGGASKADQETAIADGYRSGRFRPSRPGGISYMLSDQAFGVDSSGSRFPIPPHIMVYSPYATSQDLGYDGEHQQTMSKAGLPWILDEGSPDAWIIIWRRN